MERATSVGTGDGARPADALARLREDLALREAELAALEGRNRALVAEREALRRVSAEIAGAGDMDDVLASVAREAAGALGADRSMLVTIDGSGGELVAGASRDHLPRTWVGSRLPLSALGPLATVARTDRPARWGARPGAPSPGAVIGPLRYARAAAAVPVRSHGRPWGGLLVANVGPHPLPADAEARLIRLAEIASLAVAMGAAHEQVGREVREQMALRRLAVAAASGQRDDGPFPLAARLIGETLGADSGSVVRFEAGGGARVLGAWSATPGLAADEGALLRAHERGALAQVARSGTAARADEPLALERPAGRVVARSAVAVPIRVGGRPWGALSVLSTGPRPLPVGVPERLARFAEILALGIDASEAREQLATLASTDHLTGLANQRAFEERLDAEVERARRHGRPLALIVFDLDHFKAVNDTHGHEVGNAVLRETARRLGSAVRRGEVLARVGGEEFAWILPEADAAKAGRAAARARRAIADLPFATVGRLTTSAGVCDLTSATGASELFRLADMALYWAKEQGRNRVVHYSPEAFELLSAEEQSHRLSRAEAMGGIRVLARAVDAKDPATQRHSERVADLAQRLALARGWSPERAALLREAALVHDVGKIGVPDALLLKPSPLARGEYEQVKAHAALGAEMVHEALSAEQTEWVRHHHERPDGRGYPDGLEGSILSEGARLLGLADAWDAMLIARAYSPARTVAAALAECRAGAGTQFCPDAVAALERVLSAERSTAHDVRGAARSGPEPAAGACPPVTTPTPPSAPGPSR
jgi:diguanylate cyclase (GGDEF)-like protein